MRCCGGRPGVLRGMRALGARERPGGPGPVRVPDQGLLAFPPLGPHPPSPCHPQLPAGFAAGVPRVASACVRHPYRAASSVARDWVEARLQPLIQGRPGSRGRSFHPADRAASPDGSCHSSQAEHPSRAANASRSSSPPTPPPMRTPPRPDRFPLAPPSSRPPTPTPCPRPRASCPDPVPRSSCPGATWFSMCRAQTYHGHSEATVPAPGSTPSTQRCLRRLE